MIDKQVKQIVKKIAVNDYIMENMFCAPKGVLGRLGGQLMSQDHWLPAWVLDLLDIHPSDSVLEIGSGPGLGLQLAAARAYQGKAVGVDRSETMLEMAHHRNNALIETGRVKLHLGTVDKLPFDNATFDKAMTINSLHLWPDPVAGLKEVRRTLRKGGQIVVAITRFSYASPAKFESHLIDAGYTDVSMHIGEPGVCALGCA
jgi:ubiquinone/menaquinone biosynthesis C-methylase UbiE